MVILETIVDFGYKDGACEDEVPHPTRGFRLFVGHWGLGILWGKRADGGDIRCH